MNTAAQILNHPNYSADDYAYLSAKGWTPAQILARWNEERAAGGRACQWNGIGAASKLAATLRAVRAVRS